MSDLIVLMFNDEYQASSAMSALRELEKNQAIAFEDTAVISKDQTGKVTVKNEVSSATETGAVVGASLGLLVTAFFPVVGIAIGALGGAGVGALLGEGVDRKFVTEVTEALKPGTSALFLLIKHAVPAVV